MRTPTLLLALALAFTSCGGSDPKVLTDKGTAALGAGDTKTAIESFDAALSKMNAGDPDYLRAQMGRIQALVRVDAKKAKDDFLALAHTGAKVEEQDFSLVVNEMMKKGAVPEAAEVTNAGIKRFPESPKMFAIQKQVHEASAKVKDPKDLEKLKGLGYTGGDDSK